MQQIQITCLNLGNLSQFITKYYTLLTSDIDCHNHTAAAYSSLNLIIDVINISIFFLYIIKYHTSICQQPKAFQLFICFYGERWFCYITPRSFIVFFAKSLSPYIILLFGSFLTLPFLKCNIS